MSSSHRLRQTLPLLSKIVEEHDASTVSSIADPENAVAWGGGKVSPEFKSKVIRISKELKINPNHLMACMAFETAETFSPSIKNGSGSGGATGLIQFMPSTAESLGVNTKTLARMSALEQLDYVKAYYWPYRNKINSLEDATWPFSTLLRLVNRRLSFCSDKAQLPIDRMQVSIATTRGKSRLMMFPTK